jgi:hypothetical protein
MSEKKDYWNNHPEIQDGEIFLTNVDNEHISVIHWSTKRFGIVAYDRNGNIFGEYPKTFPVFVKKEELEKSSSGREILKKAGLVFL